MTLQLCCWVLADERMMQSLMMPGDNDVFDVMEQFLEAARRHGWHARPRRRHGEGSVLHVEAQQDRTGRVRRL